MQYVSQTMENFENLAEKMDVVLFGNGEYCMRFLNRIGNLTDRVKFILDNDYQKWGGKLYGIPVVTPEILKDMEPLNTLVVITVESTVVELCVYGRKYFVT